MHLTFGLLGPLSVQRDGIALSLGAAKQRGLLTALLLDARTVVSVDRLVELLWEDEPPRSAVANIRTYASRLRSTLRDAAGERLVSRPPGYLLAADAGELDLLRYEELSRRGRDSLFQGETAAAETAIREALSLWRGAAAEDVPRGVPLGARLAALDEERVTLIEDWMEARLRLGDHRAAVGELRELTKSHPLRERLWFHLMVALYRSGNIGAGLAVFAEARQTLVEQLGIEPGPELSGLQAAMLAHDPALVADPYPPSPERVTTWASLVPRELPADCAGLSGRQAELAAIRTAIAGNPPIVALHGPAGSGKSALALRAAHQLRDLYPDGELYVDLQGSTLVPEDPVNVLDRLLRALGDRGDHVWNGLAEAAARFRTVIAGRRMLLLLDNAVDEAQVRPLLPGTAEVRVIITSRRMLAALDCGTNIDVGQVGLSRGREMLRHLTDGLCDRFDDHDLDRLVTLCEGLPLALRIVGARMVSQPHRSSRGLVARLSDERTRLRTLCYGTLSVRSAFAASHRRLTYGAELFRLIGALHLRRLCPGVAAAALGQSAVDGERALDDLAGVRLLDQVDARTYHVPDLVRLYAAEVNAGGDPREPVRRIRAGTRPVLTSIELLDQHSGARPAPWKE
ncbi:BTAD domain-containing putative transcriptional regulator [Sphaerisporangium sp. NPDC049003]|uniref:AfsR/SARP family transcriptional regulator n=1 Tax=Sphaerisporangium sp. NPDC049003 TaxID=3364517 RepID=UPI00371D2A4A